MELHGMLKIVALLPKMKFPMDMRWQNALRSTENQYIYLILTE